MEEEKVRYGAALQGAEVDLKFLVHCFSTDECNVAVAEYPEIASEKFYLLLSTRLELAPVHEKKLIRGMEGTQREVMLDRTWEHARDEAERLLSVVHGASRLVRSQYKPVSISSMHKFSLEGRWLGSEAKSSLGDSWRDYPFPSKKTGLVDLVRLWNEKGLTDEAAFRALAIYGTQPLSWTMLYMIYEVIKDDVKGDLSKLISNNQLRDFTKSANNARSLKDGPRHAFETTVDEGNLISLREAEAVIRHILNYWLGTKVGSIMK